MGMCGGLSTMSTLAVEEFTLLRTSAVAGAIVYCLTTFVAGYVCDSYIKAIWHNAFPLSTFIINVIAGLLAGIVAALSMESAIPGDVHFLLATGFLGGFSTFSTMMNEAVVLLRKGEVAVFAAYLAVSVIVPVVSVACGYLMV